VAAEIESRLALDVITDEVLDGLPPPPAGTAYEPRFGSE
jgi:hypothetical protein